jgi:hypothetical protein
MAADLRSGLVAMPWAPLEVGCRSATGKLIFSGPSGEGWIYLIRGRNLRFEEGAPPRKKSTGRAH